MSFGSELGQARRKAKLSIEQVSARTFIRPNVIEALENDDLTPSGGMAYARGHVRTIASLVGLNPDEVIAMLEESTGVVDRPMIDLLAENFVTPKPKEASSLSYKTMATIAASVLGVLILIPTVSSFFAASPAKTIHTSTSSSASKSTSTTVPNSSSATGAVVATKTNQVSVVIAANTGTTWLGVTDSAGNQVFNGMIKQGQTRTFNQNQLLRFVIGNAGAVNLNVNGQDLGTPGAVGEVVHLEFGPGASAQG